MANKKLSTAEQNEKMVELYHKVSMLRMEKWELKEEKDCLEADIRLLRKTIIMLVMCFVFIFGWLVGFFARI